MLYVLRGFSIGVRFADKRSHSERTISKGVSKEFSGKFRFLPSVFKITI